LRSSSTFVEHVKIHLTPLAQPSNFLSLTPSLFCALRHAQSLGPDATILVIDLGVVTTGHPPARLTPAKAIIQKQLPGFKGTLRRPQVDASGDVHSAGSETQSPYSFHGGTELLVWGVSSPSHHPALI